MTTKDITELQWLAATMRRAADDLARAAKLLSASGELQRAEERVRALATAAAAPGPSERPATAATRPRPPAATAPTRDLVPASAVAVRSRREAVDDAEDLRPDLFSVMPKLALKRARELSTMFAARECAEPKGVSR